MSTLASTEACVKHEFVTPATSVSVSVAEGYERWAPSYDSLPNPLLAREERYLLPLIAGLPKSHILDLACGTGRWIDKLVSQDLHSGVGFDSSAAMLRVACAKRSIRGRLARANCESLPFRSASFDLAICSFALGHVENLASMARELGRVTKVGAEVFVSDLHPAAYARGWRVGFRHMSGSVQIAMISRAVDEINSAFFIGGFECQAREVLWIGDPERPLFESAGKSHSFAEASQIPAVLVCRFKRAVSPRCGRSSPTVEALS